MSRRIAALVAALALLPGAASAHEFWLSPSAWLAREGDTLAVRAFAGTGFRGEAKPWAAPRARRLELRTSRVTDVRALATNGDDVYARFVLPDAGGAALAYESDFATIQLPAADFDAYLALEGLDAPLAARRALAAEPPGRERYARCCRAWIPGREPARALAPVGLTLEIVPLADPARGRAGAFRVLLRGRPLANARVRAWRRPLAAGGRPFEPAARDSLPPCFSARTAADGSVRVPLGRDGEWLLSCVHMEPSADPAVADWQSQWASLTFARPERRR